MLSMQASMVPTLTQEPRLVHRQELRFTHDQRQMIRAQQTQLRIELIATLRDERYVPKGECPKCGRKLSPNEILAGFRDDVEDFTTKCTGCHTRFEPILICFGKASRIQIPFFCGVQAQHRLRSMSSMAPGELLQRFPGEYRSAVVHYGTITAMFSRLGIEYTHKELDGWAVKVQLFLGRMPDTVIAECVGVSVGTIRKARRKQGITAYNKRKTLAKAEN